MDFKLTIEFSVDTKDPHGVGKGVEQSLRIIHQQLAAAAGGTIMVFRTDLRQTKMTPEYKGNGVAIVQEAP